MRAPLLCDYRRFHGMFCGVDAARRCVASFDGTILFMPATYDPVAFVDATTKAGPLPFEVQRLTTAKYYLLVLGSLTGLCTLLGLTRTVDASEGLGVVQPKAHSLAVHPAVIESLKRRANAAADALLVRRFEFRFRLIGLSVAMHHYLTTEEGGATRLNLVEVYAFDRKLCLAAAWAIAAILLDVLLRVLLA